LHVHRRRLEFPQPPVAIPAARLFAFFFQYSRCAAGRRWFSASRAGPLRLFFFHYIRRRLNWLLPKRVNPQGPAAFCASPPPRIPEIREKFDLEESGRWNLRPAAVE
jgi:hypothetical protein